METGKETGTEYSLYFGHGVGHGQNGGKIISQAGFVRGFSHSGKVYALAVKFWIFYNRFIYKIADHVLAIIIFCLVLDCPRVNEK